MTKEEINARRRRYYAKNKERIYASQKKYIQKNRKRITKMIDDYRNKKALEYKEQGQMFCYLPKTERQNKMVERLAKKGNLTLEESKTMLEKRNWNIKELEREIKIRRK